MGWQNGKVEEGRREANDRGQRLWRGEQKRADKWLEMKESGRTSGTGRGRKRGKARKKRGVGK